MMGPIPMPREGRRSASAQSVGDTGKSVGGADLVELPSGVRADMPGLRRVRLRASRIEPSAR